ncbi:hypothetical protein GTQ40_15520 [Flavobacteriaceae bacterium R38]|nr:hypothetical protein [Flavobacteriaceae bacterium R38]
MKNRKSTFKLNKQKIASLDKELKNNIKGGRNTLAPTTTLTDPTAATLCYICPDPNLTTITNPDTILNQEIN